MTHESSDVYVAASDLLEHHHGWVELTDHKRREWVKVKSEKDSLKDIMSLTISVLDLKRIRRKL